VTGVIWMVPAAVGVVAALAVLLSARRVVRDAAELSATLGRFRDVRQPILELRAEALTLKADALDLRARPRTRRPDDPSAS
jgi:alkylation response protein AidB-like acyl-CoA dehydrogenase